MLGLFLCVVSPLLSGSILLLHSFCLLKQGLWARLNQVFVERAVAQLVEALSYKPEGREFDSPLGIFVDIILPAVIWSWVRFSLSQKLVPGISPWGYGPPERRAVNLTTLMRRLS